MPNSFYNHGSYPSTGSQAKSASLRSELDAIAAGFAKLPTLSSANAGKLLWINASGTAIEITDSLAILKVLSGGFSIKDSTDQTKIVQFDASGIATGTTRSFALPDASTTLVGTNTTQTLSNKSFSGTTYFGGVAGADSLRVPTVASAVNYLSILGSITGSAVSFVAGGTDTDVSISYKTQGAGSYTFFTAGSLAQFKVGHVASAVNYLQANGSVTGSAASFSAQGSDTNIDILLTPKGTGTVSVPAGVTGPHNGTVGATTPSSGKFTHAYSPTITLTDAASIAWDVSTGQVAKVTLGGNRTIAAPSNLLDGEFYSLNVLQDATGSRTVTWNTVFAFAGGTAPTLSTAAGAKDFFVFKYDGSKLCEQGRSQGVA